MSDFDVISIGDICTDALVRLSEEHAHVYEDGRGQWLVMPFGAKLPFEEAYVMEAVGNAANASVALARLGLSTGLVTNVGGDGHGIDMIHALHDNGVDTRFVRVNPGCSSNYHYALWFRSERTILIRHEEYEYHWPHLADADVPGWLYFSSVSEHASGYHDRVAAWLTDHPSTRLVFQPGTFELEAGPDRLERLYRASEVLILNREEASRVTGRGRSDVRGLLGALHDLGPSTVVVTDGPDGAFASDGTTALVMPCYPDAGEPVERTGAGDAFAATFVAALARGHGIEEALRWAPVNAMCVVQHVGAQAGLVTADRLGELLAGAPASFHPRPL
jgi:5-dehydro-2-deoxygluconokinase